MTAPVGETLETVTEPITAPVIAATEPVVAVVQPAAEPIVGVVDPTVARVEPVAGAVDAAAPAVETVTDVTGPIATSTPTQDVTAVVDAAADPGVGVLSGNVDQATPPLVGAPISEGSDTVMPIVEAPDSEVTVLPSVSPVVDGVATGVDGSGAVATAPSPMVPAIPESEFPTGDLLPAVPDPSFGVQPSTDLAGSSQLPIGDVLDDVLLDGVAAGLPIAAALGAATLTVVSIARGVCSPGAAVIFTNVRLVPCLVGSAVERTAMVGTQAVSGLATGDGGSNATGRRRGVVPAVVETIVDPIRDGFEKAVARDGEEDAEGLQDARLMMQIGIVLGTVYLAFLTVWFWATRMRATPRL